MMRFYIIPVGPISRLFHKEADKIVGKGELEDLKECIVPPVIEFINEVYDDTVGDNWIQRMVKNRKNTKTARQITLRNKTHEKTK